jgi:hypothetical protein
MSEHMIFSRNLIKGKIGEMIFEQMMNEVSTFTILSFGYENVLPELAQRQHDIKAEETMETIRRAPDFVVINNDTHDVYLVEVKYRSRISVDDNLKEAERMYRTWKPALLFLATPHGFYFDSAKNIVRSKGEMKPLGNEYFSDEVQEKYVTLLKEFIAPVPH